MLASLFPTAQLHSNFQSRNDFALKRSGIAIRSEPLFHSEIRGSRFKSSGNLTSSLLDATRRAHSTISRPFFSNHRRRAAVVYEFDYSAINVNENLNNTNLARGFNHFWSLQLAFWIGLCIITFLTLTVWYDQIGWRHLSHTALQGVLGIVLSYPLHIVFSSIWNAPQKLRIPISLVAVAIVSAVWNICRMILFIWLTGEEEIWSDFGGWYFGSIFVFLCWTALYHGIRYYQLLQSEHLMKLDAEATVSEEKVKRLIAETEAKDAQLKMLRYQLNPHFLFNTLNAVNSLVGTEEPKRAQKMIVELSQFLRYSLDNNPEMKIPLERELEALMLYLEIEKTRFAERLKLDFVIDDETKAALIPSLLLQPLIENSMKYAIAKSETGGEIRLRAHIYQQLLVLELSDTGTGEKTQSSKMQSGAGRGIGLRNTVDRLKAFYGSDFSFDLVPSSRGGLKTVIHIPYETLTTTVEKNLN